MIKLIKEFIGYESEPLTMGQADEHLSDENVNNQDSHISVMSKEVLDYLNPKEGEVFVDGTLGLGGHATEILKKIGASGRLIGIDRDAKSLAQAQEILKEFSPCCEFVHDDYSHIREALKRLNISVVDGIILDLGISSFQLNNPQRGFSLQSEGPLDMRMDQDNPTSAYDLVNSLSEKEIAKILHDYGQERFNFRIAHNLVCERSKHPIETTQELSRIVMRSMPRGRKWQKIHPATRTFQAFRIAVNRELELLEMSINHCIDCLKSGGRLAVIAFHSLEDKIVKENFKKAALENQVKLLMKKPLQPTEAETQRNPRSRSARLRVIERI